MEIRELKNSVVISGAKDFSLLHTFDCGQCFRFNETEDGGFEGVAFGKYVKLFQKGGDIVINNLTLPEYKEKWSLFFDMDRDYAKIKESLIKDETMKKAVAYGNGIRILRQDFFECLISFIISQQNNIPKIKKTVEGFSEMFGKKIGFGGKTYYAFPSPEDIRGITEKDLAPLKTGYRAPYIAGAVEAVCSENLSGDELSRTDYAKAKEKLLEIKGIGNKVADCILLFSLGKFEAFPVDTWIKKAMLSLYGLGEKEIEKYKDVNYGEYSGFAQQYIFYYIRNNKILT